MRLGAVNPDQYLAIFYIGGRGPVYDLPDNQANIQLANKVRTNHVSETLAYSSSSSIARENLSVLSAMALREWRGS